ncbi:methyltransferase domain-containing protein [Polaromonas sp.]|uniref:class I SAM-dependent methyltransferase n=1 Tax=Polaromonas sp. TaxID=1869339 RepID=UPI0035627C61
MTAQMTAQLTRNEKLLTGLNLQTAVGIEIGALDKPIIPPSTPHVFYVDHAETAVLRSKYQGDPYVNVDALVQVHGVWGEASLAQAAARVAPVDFVIASHVVEHVPDLIAWLQELASVLKPRGQVRLAVPDRRYTLDVLRAETRAPDVLASHLAGARRPQAREILDYMTHLVGVDTWKIWDGTQDTASLTRQSSIESGMAVARDSADNGTYHDVHCWVFTPLSFAVLMHDLASAAYQPFKCAGYFPTEHNTNEFFVTLQLCADAAEAAISWKRLQQTIEAQLDAQARELREARVREIQALQAQLQQAQAQVGVAQAQVNDAHAREALLQAQRLQEAQAAEVARLALADTVAAGQSQMAWLNDTVALMRASTSWRITAPLRALSAWLRRVRH